MNTFYCLSDLGEICLPDKRRIEELYSKDGAKVLLLLDSCVCLDIASFVKHKKASRVDKLKIFRLIEYVQKYKIEFTPIFALIELSYNRITLEMDDEKMWDFKNKIDFAFRYPIKRLKRYDFDYDTNYVVFHPADSSMNSIEPILPNLNLSYAGLLKIREIGTHGLKKEDAEKNVKQFIDWMIDDLGTFIGLEYSLALEVFGGNTKLLTMIKIGGSFEKARKTLWGSAWDLFHARLSCNRAQLQKLIGENVDPIFVTKDYALYKLLSPYVENLVRFNTTKVVITTCNGYPKHLSNDFMAEINEKILRLSVDRVGREPQIESSRLDELIAELENKFI